MRTGRPRTPIGTHGAINTRRDGNRVVAETRVRDLDGRLRQVRASGPTAAAARTRLMERIRERPSLPAPDCCGRPARSPTWRTCGWPSSICATWPGTPKRTTAPACGSTFARRSSTTPSPRSPPDASSGSWPSRPTCRHRRPSRPGRCSTFSSPSRSATTPSLATRSRARRASPGQGDTPGAHARANRRDSRGSRKVAKRTRSPRPQARWPGPRHHRSPAGHRHAPG